jgi:hypothetical protein
VSNHRRAARVVADTDQLAAARRDTANLHMALSLLLTNRTTSSPTTHVGARITEWCDAGGIAGCRHVLAPTPLLGLLAVPGVPYCRSCVVLVLRRHAAPTLPYMTPPARRCLPELP